MRARPIQSRGFAANLPVTLLALAAAVAAILGAGGVWSWIYWIAKPLTTACLFALAWQATGASGRYRAGVLAGIALSLVGDVWLMLPADHFMAGLLSFLLAHLCFISAFCRDMRGGKPAWPWSGCLAAGGVCLCVLWSGIAPSLRVPVVIYMLVLATMTALALARWLAFRRADDARAASARRAAIGGVVFMLSDSLLAWNRFHARLPLSALWVLGTYYVAVWLIARSVTHSAASREWRTQ